MKLFRLLFLTLCLFIIPLSSYAKSPLSLNIKPIREDYVNKYISVNVEYPQIYSNSTSAHIKINELLKSNIRDFVKTYEDEGKKSYEESLNSQFDFFPYNVTINYEVGQNNQNLLSIPVSFYSYTGGAHGLTTLVGYNFNPQTGKLLTLNDLFKSQSYIPYVKNYIITQINSQSDIYFDDATKAVQNLKSFDNFYVTNKDLVIFFNQYDISPYSSGIREFKIPLKNLNIYLNPKYKV